MITTKINLFVFDTKENFEKSKLYLGEENTSFKRIICVENMQEFQKEFASLHDEEYVFLVVHVFYTEKIGGLKRFVASRISKTYPGLSYMYISEGNNQAIYHEMVDAKHHEMVDAKLQLQKIYKYHEVQSSLEDETHKCLTKRDILKLSIKELPILENNNTYPHFEYAVITALYNEEFEMLNTVFTFQKSEIIRTKAKNYHVGYLKSNPQKKIVAAFQNATGMVDAAIIATQMLEYFTPRFILMSGVCGGASHKNLGDIVIASQIFMLQKGKLSDLLFEDEEKTKRKINLFDGTGNEIDLSKIQDNNGKQIIIGVEKFERDIDALINLDPLISDSLKPVLNDIKSKINSTIENDNFFNSKTVNVTLEPMACSTMVINKEGYFDNSIKTVLRGTAAVEMESYGVARATQFANSGQTIPIIFKSVMDNTSNKNDFVAGINYKKFAAYTSALFLGFLIESEVI